MPAGCTNELTETLIKASFFAFKNITNKSLHTYIYNKIFTLCYLVSILGAQTFIFSVNFLDLDVTVKLSSFCLNLHTSAISLSFEDG